MKNASILFFVISLQCFSQNCPLLTLSNYSYTYNEEPTNIVANDFNNDGKKDLVVSFFSYNNFSPYMSVFLQTTANSFNTYTLAGSGGGLSADLNGDNNNDIVGSNMTFLGTGTGSFTSVSNNITGTTLSNSLVDLDNDGKLDLVSSNYNGFITNIYFCKGLGNGTFSATITFTTNASSENIVACNLDGNANKDILLYSSPSPSVTMIKLLSGNGNGTFNAVNTFTLAGDMASNLAVWSTESVKVSDIDNDGSEDIAVAFTGNQFAILKGNNNFTFNAPVYSTVNYFPFALEDFNSDGLKDVIAIQPSSQSAYNVQMLLNNGSNTLVNPVTSTFSCQVACWGSKIVLEDFNNDGKKDYATYTYSGTASNGFMFTNTGCIWPGDANGDGLANDIDVLEMGLHINQTGPARGAPSNTWASFTCAPWPGTTSGGFNLRISDCNGDGTINASDTAAIWLNYGSYHPREDAVTSVTPQLTVIPDQSSVYKGTWGTASVYLGDASSPVTSINGIAFTANYNNTLIQTDSVFVQYIPSFINTNNLNFSKRYFSNGKIHTATTHTLNQNVSGFGKVAVLHYKIKPTLVADSVLNLGLSAAMKMSATGVLTPLTTGTGTLLATVLPTSINHNTVTGGYSLYPNPTSGTFTIKRTTQSNCWLKIYSSLGELVFAKELVKAQEMVSPSLTSGVYFYVISDASGRTSGKLVIE